MPLASGKHIAALTADAQRPQSVGVFSAAPRRAEGDLSDAARVVPDRRARRAAGVTLKAADGFEFYNQLFLPKDIKPGEKRPAMIFVHGGPARQMLLGYHYRHFYHMAYAVNQWLASQGYIVHVGELPQRRRLRPIVPQAPNTGGRGNSRVSGRARRRASTCTRDRTSTRNASASGVCRTAACSPRRRSRATPICSPLASTSPASTSGAARSIRTSVSYQSSAIGAIDKWKSPVLLVHGDDDRNVAFQQTTGLVQLLRARNVHVRAHRLPGRRARHAAALALDVHVQADGRVPEESI